MSTPTSFIVQDPRSALPLMIAGEGQIERPSTPRSAAGHHVPDRCSVDRRRRAASLRLPVGGLLPEGRKKPSSKERSSWRRPEGSGGRARTCARRLFAR